MRRRGRIARLAQAVWLSFAGRSVIDKVAVIVFPITACLILVTLGLSTTAVTSAALRAVGQVDGSASRGTAVPRFQEYASEAHAWEFSHASSRAFTGS